MTHAFRYVGTLVLAAVLLLPRHTAAEPVIQAPQQVPSGSMFIVRIEGIEKDAKFSWHPIGGAPILADLLDRTTLAPVLLVHPDRDGALHLVVAIDRDGEAPIQLSSTTMVGGTPTPVPVPVPPGPGPGPTPVPPGPSGLRVMILEETSERQGLSRGQLLALTSADVRSYLDTKAKDRWRLLDDDLDAEDMAGWSQEWIAAYKQAKELSGGTVPFVMVSNGTTGTAVKLPETSAAMLELLRRYGG